MLRFLTAGESHGRALVVIVEGIPAGLELVREEIEGELARRRLGYGRGPRMRFEADELTLIGGIRHGRTLGSPVAIMIANSEWPKWEQEMSAGPGVTEKALTEPRPGHADLAGMQKYGFGDARNVLERASARETAARVAAGCCAKALLARIGVAIVSHVVQVGPVVAKSTARPLPGDLAAVDASEVRCFDPDAEATMIAEIKAAAKDGDSLGGIVEVLAYGVPVGLGSHVHWDRKLDGLLAQAMLSIHAVKGVEIGDGFEVAGRRGPRTHAGPRPHHVGCRGRQLPAGDDACRWHRRRHVDRRVGRSSGGHETLGLTQSSGVEDRRCGHKTGVAGLQATHRRHRRAGHGGGGRDNDGAGVGGRGVTQVRRRLRQGVRPQP